MAFHAMPVFDFTWSCKEIGTDQAYAWTEACADVEICDIPKFEIRRLMAMVLLEAAIINAVEEYCRKNKGEQTNRKSEINLFFMK